MLHDIEKYVWDRWSTDNWLNSVLVRLHIETTKETKELLSDEIRLIIERTFCTGYAAAQQEMREVLGIK